MPKNITKLHEKVKKKKGSQYFVGYYLYWVVKPFLVKYAEITGYVKDFNRDKSLTIVHNKNIIVPYISKNNDGVY